MSGNGYINTDRVETKRAAEAKGSLVFAPDGGLAMVVRAQGNIYGVLRLAGAGHVGMVDPIPESNMSVLSLGSPYWSVESRPPVLVSGSELGPGMLVFTEAGQFVVAVNRVSTSKVFVRFQDGDVVDIAPGQSYLATIAWRARCLRDDQEVAAFIFDGRPNSVFAELM